MNNKAGKKKYIAVMILLFLLGGAIGFAAVMLIDKGYDFSSIFKVDSLTAGRVIAVIYAVFTLATLLAAVISLSRTGRLISSMNEEDDEAYDLIEKRLNTPALLTTVCQLAGMGLFSASCYFLMQNLKIEGIIFALIPAFVMLVSVIVVMGINSKIVDAEKKLNPEKQGSVYDMDFGRKWFGSFDEAQKQMAYKAGYHAFQTGNRLCLVLWVLTFMLQFVFRFGLMPMIIVVTMWLTMNLSYIRAAARLESGKENV